MRKAIPLLIALFSVTTSAYAADPIKIGMSEPLTGGDSWLEDRSAGGSLPFSLCASLAPAASFRGKRRTVPENNAGWSRR